MTQKRCKDCYWWKDGDAFDSNALGSTPGPAAID